jgi:hypothetical protein
VERRRLAGERRDSAAESAAESAALLSVVH